MKKFLLIPNLSKEGSAQMAARISRAVADKGGECVDKPEDAQCIITLGGDGTLIQAARDYADLQLPIIGVNMGHLGYLTSVAGNGDLEPMLDALLKDRFTLEKRMMLEGRVVSRDGVKKGIALNDIVLTRKDVLQVLRFQVYLNGEFFSEYTADGIIATTPTGSTAYNLSAGGPIVAPKSNLMALTPICAHSLNSRSIVLSAEDTVTIRLAAGEDKAQTAVFDGDKVLDMEPGDALEISRAESYTTLIQLENVSFLEILRNKMTRI